MADDYDYEAYKKKYGEPDQSKGQHLTDEFKKPNHITFSDESIYHSKETPGGHWGKEPDGKTWGYTPSDHVIRTHGMDKLTEYFKEKEPDAVLHLPRRDANIVEKVNKIKNAGPEE